MLRRADRKCSHVTSWWKLQPRGVPRRNGQLSRVPIAVDERVRVRELEQHDAFEQRPSVSPLLVGCLAFPASTPNRAGVGHDVCWHRTASIEPGRCGCVCILPGWAARRFEVGILQASGREHCFNREHWRIARDQLRAAAACVGAFTRGEAEWNRNARLEPCPTGARRFRTRLSVPFRPRAAAGLPEMGGSPPAPALRSNVAPRRIPRGRRMRAPIVLTRRRMGPWQVAQGRAACRRGSGRRLAWARHRAAPCAAAPPALAQGSWWAAAARRRAGSCSLDAATDKRPRGCGKRRYRRSGQPALA